MTAMHAVLLPAVSAAINGDWTLAHSIAQAYDDPLAHWLHAVLHKIEGDEANSRYWYARSQGHHYDAFQSVDAELQAIFHALYPDAQAAQ